MIGLGYFYLSVTFIQDLRLLSECCPRYNTRFLFCNKICNFFWIYVSHTHSTHAHIGSSISYLLHTLLQPKAQVLPIAVIHPEKRGKRRRGNLHKIRKSQTSGLQSNNFWKSTKIQPFIDRGGYYGVPKISTVGILLTNLFGIYFLKFCSTLQILKSWIFNQLLCLADWTRRHDPDKYRDFQLRNERVS